MFPFFQIGSLAIQAPGLILLVGVWAGLTLSEKLVSERKKLPLSADQLSNIVWFGLAAGILGARVGYILLFPDIFISNPLSIVSLNPGLLDTWFGAGAALVAMVIVAQRYDLTAAIVLDGLTPMLAVLGAAIALASLASGARYGLPSDAPWAVDLFGASRHPAQLYDFLAAAAIIAFLLLRRKKFHFGDGKLFVVFVALSAGATLFLEAFHATGPIVGGWRLVQLAAWLVLAVCLWLLRTGLPARRKGKHAVVRG